MPQALDRVKREAVITMPKSEFDQIREWREKKAKNVTDLEELLGRLWDVEQVAKQEVAEKLVKAREGKTLLDNRFNYAQYYHELSFEPLSWRNVQGWPSLVVFSTGSPTVTFTATSSNSWITPSLPERLSRPYQDVLNILIRRAAKKNNQQSLIFQLDGVIPEDARAKGVEAQQRGLSVFLIAEPTRIEVVERPIPAPIDADPLLVGLDSSGQLWLIADFDTTSVEQAMFFHPVR
jgi:hypothetical protein